jgi:hypothetical protein
VIDLGRHIDLRDRVAVVTGASGGLGERFSRVLHAAGATVVVSARRSDRLGGLADELGERVITVPADVAIEGQRADLIDQTVERFGQIDILVNNAGIGTPAPAEDETVEHFREVLEVNVTAPFHLAQLAARHMLAAGSGAIVNIASMFGFVAASPIKQASYCASKAALINLTRELAAQWGHRGVRVNGIAPGWFESEMTEPLWADPKSVAFVERNTPLRRRAAPHELDGVLLLLVGPGNSFIAGETICIDGGWLAR